MVTKLTEFVYKQYLHPQVYSGSCFLRPLIQPEKTWVSIEGTP